VKRAGRAVWRGRSVRAISWAGRNSRVARAKGKRDELIGTW